MFFKMNMVLVESKEQVFQHMFGQAKSLNIFATQ